jgi:hypothetical protein
MARVGINKAQKLTSGCEIYDLVYAGKRKQIFQTCLVQARVVNSHPPFLIFFGTRTGLDIQSEFWTSLMKPAVESFANSSPMALRFSLLKRRMPCLTGLDLGLMLRLCSETS